MTLTQTAPRFTISEPRRKRVSSSKTNPLGPGTCNLPINMPIAERAILGKAAFKRGESMGSLCRTLIVAGLEKISPEDAAKVKDIIRKSKGGLSFLLVIGFCIATFDGSARIAPRRNNYRNQTTHKSTRRELEAA